MFFDETPRLVEFVANWAHTLTHCAKVLARIGIHVVGDGELQDVRQSMIVALDEIDNRPISDEIRSAIWALTLRWLAAGDLIVSYAENGAEFREAIILDALGQVEMLVTIASGLLDQRDAMN
ncbi:hypothetical protein Ssi03_62480 [Sphaerisporangium siamense]|uniref:Uncharacterized protein n=1 Tax=Sphaerisporangium siamense TaxID=795645 RepID=A0A7W7DBY8_9ACTN|nr:hypothetical protein [Sphaerisporangium siamense]MBB4702558.1 hypothetical protein [Sphaerisporangium siamense]GII88258.1 hypothetical protein Ssi03_62480 [Sphaerisporangium siamense]